MCIFLSLLVSLASCFFPLYILYSRLLYSTYTSHSCAQHVQAALSVLSIQLNSNKNDKHKSVALNIYEAHLSHYTYSLCINSAFTHAMIHARICAWVYRIRVDRSLQPPQPNPECVICCLSTVDWEPCTNADLLLAALVCDFISALCHRSNLSKTVRQPAPHSISSNSIHSPI